ncbi:MAG: hypothetical protein WAZ27_03850 [Minisyncoccia bacterium]
MITTAHRTWWSRLSSRPRLSFFFLTVVALLVTAEPAFAGFGITPPYVRNDRLTRGTVYEQRILLVRSDPTTDLKAEITMNIPGVEEWFTIDKGKEFILPAGETQTPIIVTVRVPDDAAYEKHKGTIRIRTSSDDAPKGGGVSIALGAQVEVGIEVVDKIYDFTVRKIRVIDLEEGRRKWGLFFPAKIRFFMSIENTGNTEFGPTKVRFEIYDSEMEQLLETVENTNTIEQIAPFEFKEVLAELPTRLPAGRYGVKYTIFKNDEIAQQNELTLSISTIGSVAGYEGYGFNGLSTSDKLKVAAVFGIPVLVLIGLIGIFVRRRMRMKARYRAL